MLTRRGFVTPQPRKRPKASYTRFQADQPNERWQLDVTHWQLADGSGAEILNIIDDHSRLCLGSDTLPVFKARDVNNSFSKAVAAYGNPASLLSDNGAVFTGRYRGTGSQIGRCGFTFGLVNRSNVASSVRPTTKVKKTTVPNQRPRLST